MSRGGKGRQPGSFCIKSSAVATLGVGDSNTWLQPGCPICCAKRAFMVPVSGKKVSQHVALEPGWKLLQPLHLGVMLRRNRLHTLPQVPYRLGKALIEGALGLHRRQPGLHEGLDVHHLFLEIDLALHARDHTREVA